MIIKIGRSPNNDYVVNNMTVSREHAVLEVDDGHIIVKDVGSKSGTYVVVDDKLEKTSYKEVTERDVIIVGDEKLYVKDIVSAASKKNREAVKHMTTISEFVDSTALDETIVSNCSKYREKFIKIVNKSGVGGSDTKDKQAINKIISTQSWNWAAFFFNTHWAIYRKEKLLGWLLFIATWLNAISAIYISVPALDTLGNIFAWVVAVFCGMYGNSFVFRNSLQTYENTTSSKDREQRSPTGLAVAIGIDLAIIGIIGFLMSEEII